MEFTKDYMNLKSGTTKEWIITNGIGGYASSTIIGTNTRKYHGLLVAPLTPPARRFLILSKVDESLELDGETYNLFTNMCQGYVSEGYKYQASFEKNFMPIFRYNIEDIFITKIVCMEYGKNTVCIYYKIINTGDKKAKMTITPIINFRDFHQVNKKENFHLRQNAELSKIKLSFADVPEHPMYMRASEGKYTPYENNIFYNMYYAIEENRGFDPYENHIVPGSYEIEIDADTEKEISFIYSLEENIEEVDVRKVIDNEIIRLNKVFNNSLLVNNKKSIRLRNNLDEDLIKSFLVAADNFIVYRPQFGYHTVIAGYPWFLDWGRDSLIAMEGILLIPKRFQEAREVFLTMVRDVKQGLVPNGYSGFDNRPLYNSVDASLLLFEQVQKYIRYTEDYTFVKTNLYPKMKEIIENYIKGIDIDNNNIYLDEDGLIVSGTPNTQNTWMDAKYNGIVATPRNGKAVEINSLWYNALRIIERLADKFGEKKLSKDYAKLAGMCQKTFNEKFYNPEKKSLYDVLGDDKIRPNQLFSMSLTYPVLNLSAEEIMDILDTIEEELVNDYGLKTLASKEPGYVDVYEGGEVKRDSSYHQGITWPWLLGLYYDALKNMQVETRYKVLDNKIEKLKEKTKKTFEYELEQNGCVGSISELYDSVEPQLPKGAIAQAWSVSEIFRIILGK